MALKIRRLAGGIGAIAYLVILIRTPSFPTPDKLLVLTSLGAMAFGQAKELLKRFVPFVALLLVYESFRGLIPRLNAHVNYTFLPAADRFLFFGHLPTQLLQNLLWRGHVAWYDFAFYIAYMLHFVLPFALAILIWKTRESHYWRCITTYLIVTLAAFVTYLAFPSAPPWLASDKGLIQPITRISSNVWYALGIHDFPSVYNKISPNPVAAMPSLHAAYALIFVLFVTKLFSTRWRYLAWLYPFLIWIGTVYQGEHYAIDEVAGIMYAILAYMAAPNVLAFVQKVGRRLKIKFLRQYKSVVK